ncbi:CpaE family protein [Cellulomonas sp. 179-A 9B4 NHS]|uniref:AAA family ATPase n=1 Tax=Cellulomonas sp. 179-A 9B4 NHS TaxID=3142379 RepID=UPI00399FA3D9
MGVGVLCAVQGAAESAIVQAVEGSGGRLSVTRRCADLTELLAAAEAGLGGLAVVSADLERLDREAVAVLHRCGVRVVGLGDPTRPWLAERLAAHGADLVVDVPADADAVVRDALGVLAGDAPARPAAAPDPVPVSRPGATVAVWGPTGAPGRTFVAVNVAAELAALGLDVLLVDADTYGGVVAQVLGVLDESPGLAAAARAAGQGALDLPTLARLAPVVLPRLRLLSGVARADRWPELPGSSLEEVLRVARGLADVTVVDTGFAIEQDEVLSYDTRAPVRNAATLTALEQADLVLVVGAADPVGVQRLVRALGEASEKGLAVTRRVVVNRLRPTVAGPRPAESVAAALARYAGVHDVALVPDDRAAADAALLEGRALREVAPGSPARRSLAALAAEVATTVGAEARTTVA